MDPGEQATLAPHPTGAAHGHGLTAIANLPNQPGQSILNRYFEKGISPLGLLKSTLIPIAIALTSLPIPANGRGRTRHTASGRPVASEAWQTKART
ncbi:MAG: hypothetical protein JSV78_10555 [Phycisphaerales bacterium]|nr:MAG: hypothetical protein JSV78_10555 [Phycisphaerales bacterium]